MLASPPSNIFEEKEFSRPPFRGESDNMSCPPVVPSDPFPIGTLNRAIFPDMGLVFFDSLRGGQFSVSLSPWNGGGIILRSIPISAPLTIWRCLLVMCQLSHDHNMAWPTQACRILRRWGRSVGAFSICRILVYLPHAAPIFALISCEVFSWRRKILPKMRIPCSFSLVPGSLDASAGLVVM